MTTIDRSLLAAVSGGFDEKQLRGWASQHCPSTYQGIADKSSSEITRADADRCLAEAKPDFVTRALINSQLDGYFGGKR